MIGWEGGSKSSFMDCFKQSKIDLSFSSVIYQCYRWLQVILQRILLCFLRKMPSHSYLLCINSNTLILFLTKHYKGGKDNKKRHQKMRILLKCIMNNITNLLMFFALRKLLLI